MFKYKRIAHIIIFSFICSCCRQDILKESFFTLSRHEINVSYEKTEECILVSSDTEWNVEDDIPDWLSVSTVSSEKTGSIFISIQENKGIGIREGNILLSHENGEAVIKVTQEDRKVLYFDSPKILKTSAEAEKISVPVVCNTAYLAKSDVSWLKVNSSSGSSFAQNYFFSNVLPFDAEKNVNSSERTGNIIIYNEIYNISDTLSVLQPGSGTKNDANADGSWSMLQEATLGNVNLVIMGDGFTKETLTEGGEYEKSMRIAMENFFSIEPYKTFRDYFNVYQVIVESVESGVGDKRGKYVNNRLGSKYGSGTEVDCNLDECLSYVEKIDLLPAECPVTVIIVLNDSKYAGTTYMYASGDAIALCPMSNLESPNDFEGLIHHEAGGHGFGFLTDEYVYYQETITSDKINDMKEWQSNGYMMNLCFSGIPEIAPWYDMIRTGLYPQVGMYEGGGLYQYGVWRSESNSCMNNNIPYYNAQSRRIIINRIMELSQIPYTFEQFIEDDSRTDITANNACMNKCASVQVGPLAAPVYINGTFRHQQNRK